MKKLILLLTLITTLTVTSKSQATPKYISNSEFLDIVETIGVKARNIKPFIKIRFYNGVHQNLLKVKGVYSRYDKNAVLIEGVNFSKFFHFRITEFILLEFYEDKISIYLDFDMEDVTYREVIDLNMDKDYLGKLRKRVL